MESVRLHHPTLASCTYVVELQQRYDPPYECYSCKITHHNKAIHLRLDSNGDVFVHRDILKLLRQVPTMAGLEIQDGRNAPPQFVGALEQPTQHIVLPYGTKYSPGWTKYQAGERMQKPFESIANALAEEIDRQETAILAEKRTLFIMGRRK